MAAYVTTIEWNESILIAFEKGFIRVDLPAPLARQLAGKVTVMCDNGKSVPTLTQPIMPNTGAMRQQAINFLAAVRGDKPAPCTAKEALEDLKLARDYIYFMARYQNK